MRHDVLDTMQELTDTERLDITGSRSAVELTLPPTNLSHTGTYTCLADNGFQVVSEDVSLTVYPRGMQTLWLWPTLQFQSILPQPLVPFS